MKLRLALSALCFSWFVLANDLQTYGKIASESCQLVSVLDNGQTLMYNCSGETIYKAADEQLGTVSYMEQNLDRNLTNQLIRLIDICTAYIKTLSLEIAYYFKLIARPCQVKREIVIDMDGRAYQHLSVENVKNDCDMSGQIGAIIDYIHEWVADYQLLGGIWCICQDGDGPPEGWISDGSKEPFSMESCGSCGTW